MDLEEHMIRIHRTTSRTPKLLILVLAALLLMAWAASFAGPEQATAARPQPDTTQCAPGAVQPNPLLDNFEALTLGPVLPDGRQSLVLVSDDNFNRSQTTRVIVLAVEDGLLEA